MNPYRICKVCQQKTDKQICPVCGGREFSEVLSPASPVSPAAAATKQTPQLACIKCGKPVLAGKCSACGFELSGGPFAMLSGFSLDRMGTPAAVGAHMVPPIEPAAVNKAAGPSVVEWVAEQRLKAAAGKMAATSGPQPETEHEAPKNKAEKVSALLTVLKPQTADYWYHLDYTLADFNQHAFATAVMSCDYNSLSEKSKNKVDPGHVDAECVDQITVALSHRNNVDDLLYSMLSCYMLADLSDKVSESQNENRDPVYPNPDRTAVLRREWKRRRDACLTKMKELMNAIDGLSETAQQAFFLLDTDVKFAKAFVEFSEDDTFEKCAGKSDRFLEYIKI